MAFASLLLTLRHLVIGCVLLLGSCGAVPNSPGVQTNVPSKNSKLELLVQTNERVHGHFAHSGGIMIFDATPHNVSITTVQPNGEHLPVLRVSEHCAERHPGTERCATGSERFSFFAIAPTAEVSARFMKVNGRVVAVPAELDMDDEAAIATFFRAHRHVFDAAAHEMHVPLLVANSLCALAAKHYHHHVSPLVDLYHAMYGEYGIIGRENPSALVLYLFAKDVAHDVSPAIPDDVVSDVVTSDDATIDSSDRRQLQQTTQPKSQLMACKNSASSKDAEWDAEWDFSVPGSCGHRCEASAGGTWIGSCGTASPDCSNSCNGMCGKGCECWPGVCGDCCAWKGCVEHDASCRGRWGALAVMCSTGAMYRQFISSETDIGEWCAGGDEASCPRGQSWSSTAAACVAPAPPPPPSCPRGQSWSSTAAACACPRGSCYSNMAGACVPGLGGC